MTHCGLMSSNQIEFAATVIINDFKFNLLVVLELVSELDDSLEVRV